MNEMDCAMAPAVLQIEQLSDAAAVSDVQTAGKARFTSCASKSELTQSYLEFRHGARHEPQVDADQKC